MTLKPFTVDHFVGWAHELTLDTGERWVVEDFFAEFVDDYFEGVPESWLLVPEGNAKTTSLAGLGVYLLEHRFEAMIPWAASSRDQAEIGYRQADGFVRRSPRLKSFLKCKGGYRRIENTLTSGRLQVFAADDGTGDGVIFTDAFLDELHRHKNLALYRIWQGKLDKRGGQMAAISTAGEPGSDFEETRDRIRRETPVIERRDGFIRCRSAHISLHEHAVTDGADVEDMAVVKAANPASFITEKTLANKRGRPTMTPAHWRRFTCNQATRGVSAAITEKEWADAFSEILPPEGEEIWAGLDLGWKADTTAIAPLWMRDPEFRLLFGARILVPPPEGMLDSREIEQAFLEIHERNPIHTVVMDPTRGETISQWIERELGAVVVEYKQTRPLQVLAYTRFMDGLSKGWLKHDGNPELTRHVLNAISYTLPRGDTIFDRPNPSRRNLEAQTRRVIDALDAASFVHSTAVAELYDEEELGLYVFDPHEAVAA